MPCRILFFLVLSSFSLKSVAQNLINNGSFEFGGPGVGFWIDGQGYNQLTPPYSGSTSAGNYAFVSNPQTLNTLSFLSTGDHTSGAGIMMVVDGTTTGGQQRFWKAGNNGGGICNLVVGQTYTFSYWIRTVSNSVAGNSELANIGVSFNNASNVVLSFGTALAPLPNFGWQQVRYTFTPTNACVNIELYNNNEGFIGNDFAIDDLSLTPPTPPLDFTYSLTQPNCTDPNSGLIVIYPIGGESPYVFRIIGPQPIPITNSTGIFQNVEPGTYTIGLMDATGTIDSIQNIEITSISNLDVTPGDTAICPGNQITLNASGGNGNFTWESSNVLESGFPSSNAAISVSPTITTTYTVSSAVNNANLVFNNDFQMGNQGFQTAYTYYAPNNPTGAQRAYGVLTNPSNWFGNFSSCLDHTIGDGTGKMMVIDGSTYNAGNDPFWCQLIAVEPNKDYLFSYWATSLTASNLAQIQVKINGVSLGITTVPSQLCSWGEVTFVWNSGNNTTAEICLSDNNTAGPGNDFAIDDISLRSQNNCSQDVTVSMAGVESGFDITYPLSSCLNEGPISPIFGASYVPGGVFNSVQQGLNINPANGVITTQGSTPGVYEITYSASLCGSFVTDTFITIIRPLPGLLELTGGDYYCEGQTFNPLTLFVEGTPDYTIYYSLDGVSQMVNASSSPISIGNAYGIYSLDSISDAYCSNEMVGAQTISINDAPVAPIITGDSVYCVNELASQLQITNLQGVINWYGDSNQTIYLGAGESFLPSTQQSATYYATQYVNNCEGPIGQFSITINPCSIVIPSAFTPNDDLENDFWELVDIDLHYPQNLVKVYNRWGEKIYESTKGNYSDNPWNGKYKEAALPVGSYFYVIDLYDSGDTSPLNGVVSIILKK